MPDFVPKIHPMERDLGPEDPMELMAEPVVGDPEVMLQCLVQEFAWLGWDTESLLSLFHSPMYPVLNQLRELFGDEEVRRRVEDILGHGGIRVTETISEDPEEDAFSGAELVQLAPYKPRP